MRPHQLLGLVGLLAKSTWAIELDITNTQNVKDVASTMAYGMLSRYTGNLTGDVPGNLPDPYHCRFYLTPSRPPSSFAAVGWHD